MHGIERLSWESSGRSGKRHLRMSMANTKQQRHRTEPGSQLCAVIPASLFLSSLVPFKLGRALRGGCSMMDGWHAP
eukprot:1137191-Pelagomonas_calceolata.AAC.4